jgi:hypothetical protein
LEYHLPESYSEERPGFILTEKKYDVRIEEHPLGSKFPRPPIDGKDKPIFMGDPMAFTSITRDPAAPKRLEHWTSQDIPQLIFHVACFENATLFTITWGHTLMDAMGLSAILNAVSLILQGRDDEVPAFLGAEEDPLADLGKNTKPESFILYRNLITAFNGILFGLNLAVDLLINRQNSLREICVPKDYFQRIYKQARPELELTSDLKQHHNLPANDTFISESDVLFAWWLRTLLTALKPRRKDNPVALMNVFDFRSLVPDLLPKSGVYIGNGTFALNTLLPAWQILSAPLSSVAQAVRRSLDQQRTREQVEAVAALHKASLEKSGYTAMFGSPSQYLLVLSNWHRVKLYEIDFSPALINPAQKAKNSLAGKPTYVHPVGYNNGFSIRNFGAVSGRDHEGNWWFTWFTGDDTWEIIEKALTEPTAAST